MSDTLHYQDEPKEPKDLFFDPEANPVTRKAKKACEELIRLYLEAEATHHPRTRQRKQKDAQLLEQQLGAILANLVAGAVRKKPSALAVTQSKRILGHKDSHPVLNDKLPVVLDVLHKAGILTKKRGDYSERRQATIEAAADGEALIGYFALSRKDFHRKDRKPIVLRQTKTVEQRRKNQSGNEMSVPDTEDVRRMTEEVNRFNDFLGKQDIRYVGPRSDIDDERTTMHRVFNNGSLTQGGRLYGGFWQQLKGEDEDDGTPDERLDIQINGECVVGLDYGQIHIRILYSFERKEPTMADAYVLPGWETSREGMKQLINAMLNDPNNKTRAVKKWFNDPLKRRVPELTQAVKECIYEHHAPITKYFGKQYCHRLCYEESNLLMRLLMELIDLNIPALPIHDCLYVGEQDADTVRELMKRRFYELFKVSIDVG